MVIIALPLWLIILIIVAPLIYLEDKGSIFYNAERLGKNGNVFIMYKFRTMKMNAPDMRNEDKSTYNASDDKRLTRVGKYLRYFSIDETPQIINVLKHEMSVIGPRPDLPEHLNYYQQNDMAKLNVLPGITGYNQAYYRNSVEWGERLKHDVFYVEHLTFGLDLKIIIKTVFCLLKKQGIYIQQKSYECVPLEWDTDYFGIPSAKVILNREIRKKDQLNIMKECKQYKFVTIYNLNNCKENNLWIGQKTNAFLTDINIQFILEIKQKPDIKDEYVEIYQGYAGDDQILLIAQQAFIYSRFFNDLNLNRERASNLYYYWTKNAFGNPNKFFVICRRNDEIAGFLLFSIDSKSMLAMIELIAVAFEYRGQSVGTSLIYNMMAYVYEGGIKHIKVGTQVENITAIQFYKSIGFQYLKIISIYHLWH